MLVVIPLMLILRSYVCSTPPVAAAIFSQEPHSAFLPLANVWGCLSQSVSPSFNALYGLRPRSNLLFPGRDATANYHKCHMYFARRPSRLPSFATHSPGR